MTSHPAPRTTGRSRRLAALGAAALVLGLAACASGQGGDPTPAATATASAPVAPPSPGATVSAPPAPAAPTGDDAIPEGSVQAEDGSFSLVLPEGFAQVPAQQVDDDGNPLPEGFTKVLQASRGEGDAATFYVLRAAEADVAGHAERTLAAFEQLRDTSGDSTTAEVRGPLEADADGAPATIVQLDSAYLNPTTGQPVALRMESMSVSHGGAGYIVAFFGPQGEPEGALPAVARTWRWG